AYTMKAMTPISSASFMASDMPALGSDTGFAATGLGCCCCLGCCGTDLWGLFLLLLLAINVVAYLVV
ncbi:hypothetical protein, partial [Bifidobacterium animalis]|uniref:hypothetical protein n=1 Tax=Bifidobacterium animalis TaxID=28025 RepID=UPI00318FD9F5